MLIIRAFMSELIFAILKKSVLFYLVKVLPDRKDSNTWKYQLSEYWRLMQ